MFTLNCRRRLLYADTPLVMGIINATPDSFYRSDLRDGYAGIADVAEKMLAEGADIIDIGGQSTRPGSTLISEAQEKERVLPAIKEVLMRRPEAVVSVDTFYSSVAAAAIEAGASIVNDVSGGNADPLMIDAVAALRAPFVCMHMKGTPAAMKDLAVYEDVVKEVLDYFIEKKERCTSAGIKDIIIDPGFGFAKNAAQNFALLKDLELFKMLDAPLLAGLSRKSTVYKTLNISPGEALNGTTVLNTIALLNGADILRVHDVREAKEAVSLLQHVRK